MRAQPPLLSRSFRMFFASPGLYLAVAFPLFILLALLLNVTIAVFIVPFSFGGPSNVGDPATIWMAMSGARKAGFIFSFIFSIWVPTFLAARGITFIAAGQYAGRAVPAGELAAATARFIPTALVFSLVPGLPISAASTFLFLPGLAVAAACSLMIASATVEGIGPFAAIGRSLSLAFVSGRLLRALGLLLVCFILIVAGEVAGYAVAPLLPWAPRTVVIMACLSLPWTLAIIMLNISLTLLYFEAAEKFAPSGSTAVAPSTSAPPPPKPATTILPGDSGSVE